MLQPPYAETWRVNLIVAWEVPNLREVWGSRKLWWEVTLNGRIEAAQPLLLTVNGGAPGLTGKVGKAGEPRS